MPRLAISSGCCSAVLLRFGARATSGQIGRDHLMHQRLGEVATKDLIRDLDCAAVLNCKFHQTLLDPQALRSEEHTSELQSRGHLVCRLLLEKKKETCGTPNVVDTT